MKTIYTIRFPEIAAYTTNLRQPDGYGEWIVESYRDLIFKSIYMSTNKNLKETARLMGWSEEKTRSYLTEMK